MYLLFAPSIIALIVILAANLHGLTKAFRRTPKKVFVPTGVLAMAMTQSLKSDRSR